MIVIRTAASPDIGIGHVIRMGHLARALAERNHPAMLLLTSPYPTITPYIADLKVAYLYPTPETATDNEADDAERTLEWLANQQVEHVVVDSYALGVNWERRIAEAGYRVAAIDDLGTREHYVDLLVDARWTGSDLTPTRYEGLVPPDCRRLLGPAYALLDPGYRSPQGDANAEAINILFSLGGGGNLNLLTDVIDALRQQMPEDWNLIPVIGPLAYNAERLIALAREDERIRPLLAPPSLRDAYRNATLFVGALGTSLYELAALGTPALTFSLAGNQDNSLPDLEELGHFLHLPREDFLKADRTAALIRTLIGEIDRIRSLRGQARVLIDGFGARRVAQALLGEPVDSAATPTGQSPANITESLTDDLSIRAVTDADINRYLQARNLVKNRQNMTITQPIPQVDHYRWWFTTRRQSFLLEKNGQPMLYIWHQHDNFDGRPYLTGGWFVCDESVGFDIAAIALEWQLRHTAQLHPDATWVAVINKENRYVNLLNRYMGFTPIPRDDAAYPAVQHFFGKADPETFNYVQCRPGCDDLAGA